MAKHIGETALTKVFELIEEKVRYLKELIDGKAPSSHTQSASTITGLSAVATSGSYNDLNGKPTIPTVPSSLPANGGNADTVDGYHIRTASEGDTGLAGYITFIV